MALEPGKADGQLSLPNQTEDSDTENDEVYTKADEGWEDVEPDTEDELSFVSFFDSEEFPSLSAMLWHAKERYNFDFLDVVNVLNLDDLETIKLINYVRSESKAGKTNIAISGKEAFEGDEYMIPVLAEDSVLIHVGDLRDLIKPVEQEADQEARQNNDSIKTSVDKCYVQDLEEKNQQLEAQLQMAKAALAAHYDEAATSRSNGAAGENTNSPKQSRDDDTHYFQSYGYNDIHETMLKDTIRTDAYRDFIYLNKDIFKDKVVLDIGCGTGILSMFCAKAGARKVIAVDNSDIIRKATRNVYENDLAKIVTCIFGKIEEIQLPVDKVDIIISEWMGYCLLYEAMLDSVLWARNKYLKPDGLMVPSYCTLRLAPVSDSEYMDNTVNFWNDVYGFKMTSMLDKIGEDVIVRSFSPENIAAPSQEFLILPLQTIKSEDLTFKDKPFEFKISQDIDMLDGFAIWFDTFFTRSPDATIKPKGVKAEEWKEKEGGEVAFTTGPGGKETHWQQCMMMITHLQSGKSTIPLQRNQVVRGTIGYSKRETNSRELDVNLKWEAESDNSNDRKEYGQRIWSMR
ncbi:MAG: hypothetical protein M1814_006906 [Vezdaea aestivalis]|nr:MAG: hypothetical protein M1814_006906 [Vezdaea aestivalis]